MGRLRDDSEDGRPALPLWDPEPEPYVPDWVREGEPVEALYTGPRGGSPADPTGTQQRQADCLDELVPPAYKGKTWTYYTRQGMVTTRFPPIRDDPQGPVTQAFIDFQDHAHALKRANHPEYYCVECRAVYVTAVCPQGDCRSSRVGPTGGPRTAKGTPYRCLECRRGFQAALVCGKCRTDLGEAASQLPLPLVAPRRTGSKKGAARSDELYPD